MADHTFLVCSSQRSRRRVFKSSSKSSFAASAANAVYDFVGHWGPLSCLIVCLLTFSSAQSAVYKSLFGTFLFVSLRQHFLCLSVVIVDCAHLYFASALGVFYGGHARCDVHPCYPGDRQTVFSFLFFSCHCNVVYRALLNLI